MSNQEAVRLTPSGIIHHPVCPLMASADRIILQIVIAWKAINRNPDYRIGRLRGKSVAVVRVGRPGSIDFGIDRTDRS